MTVGDNLIAGVERSHRRHGAERTSSTSTEQLDQSFYAQEQVMTLDRG